MSVLKKYNPDQAPGGTLVLHKTSVGCCGDKLKTCKYFYNGSGPSVNDPVTAVTINTDKGPKVLVFEAPATTPKEARKAIAKVLKENGYDPYGGDTYKGVVVNPGYYQIIGEAEILSITVDGVAQAVTANCTMGSVCRFIGVITYASGGPASYELMGDGFPVQVLGSLPSGTGDSAAVKASVQAALTAAGYDFEKVEVEEDLESEEYIFKIHTTEDVVLELNEVPLLPNGCYVEFVA